MTRFRPAAVVALCCLVIAAIALATRPDVWFSCDGGSKFLITQGLVTHSPVWPALPYPAGSIDPNGDFFPIRDVFAIPIEDGLYLSAFPIWFPILSAPGVALFGMRGLVLLPILSALLCLAGIAALGSRLNWSEPYRTTGSALVAFATPFAFYGAAFWEHVPALVPVIAALLLLLGHQDRARHAIGAGLLIGIAALLRPESVWIGVGLSAALALQSRRRGMLLGVGCAAGLAVVGAMNYFAYGHALGPQVHANLGGARLSWIFVLVRLVAGKNLARGWTIVALIALLLGLFRGRWIERVRLVTMGVLLLPIARALLAQSLPPGSYRSFTGILETSPFFFLLPLRASSSGEGRALLLTRAAVIAAAGIIATSPVEGGPQGGSRLLLVPLVLGALGLVTWLCSGPRGWQGRAAIIALVLSLPLSARALPNLIHRTNALYGMTLDQLREMRGACVVHEGSLSPQELAAHWSERPALLAGDPPRAAMALALLEGHGASSLVWVSPAASDAPLTRVSASGSIWSRTDSWVGPVYRLTRYVCGSPGLQSP